MVFQLMLPLLIALVCLFYYFGSMLLLKLQQNNRKGQRSLLQKLLGLMFVEPSSDQNLKVSPASLQLVTARHLSVCEHVCLPV